MTEQKEWTDVHHVEQKLEKKKGGDDFVDQPIKHVSGSTTSGVGCRQHRLR